MKVSWIAELPEEEPQKGVSFIPRLANVIIRESSRLGLGVPSILLDWWICEQSIYMLLEIKILLCEEDHRRLCMFFYQDFTMQDGLQIRSRRSEPNKKYNDSVHSVPRFPFTVRRNSYTVSDCDLNTNTAVSLGRIRIGHLLHGFPDRGSTSCLWSRPCLHKHKNNKICISAREILSPSSRGIGYENRYI